jgi:hypothetical protein
MRSLFYKRSIITSKIINTYEYMFENIPISKHKNLISLIVFM